MIQAAAYFIALLVGLYFIVLGSAALVRPKLAGKFLLGFAGTPTKHYCELIARLLVGLSFVTLAPSLPYSRLFSIAGWVLIATTCLMALLPWRIHSRIAQSSVPKALPYLPFIGIASLIFGGLVLAALWQCCAA